MKSPIIRPRSKYKEKSHIHIRSKDLSYRFLDIVSTVPFQLKEPEKQNQSGLLMVLVQLTISRLLTVRHILWILGSFVAAYVVRASGRVVGDPRTLPPTSGNVSKPGKGPTFPSRPT